MCAGMGVALTDVMAARFVLGDARERTLALGPLDLFPVAPDEATTFVNGPPPTMRRGTGISVAIQGGTLMGEDEFTLASLARPSALLRVNGAIRRVRALWARMPSGRIAWNAVAVRVPAVMDRVRPVVRRAGTGVRLGAAWSGRAVARGATSSRRAIAHGATWSGAAIARLVAAFHAVDRAQKRTAAGAFLAGVLVTSIVAWIV